jgi:hypothetical protein
MRRCVAPPLHRNGQHYVAAPVSPITDSQLGQCYGAARFGRSVPIWLDYLQYEITQ